jgi:hypothetical protein
MLNRYHGYTGPILPAIPAPPFPEPSFGQTLVVTDAPGCRG